MSVCYYTYSSVGCAGVQPLHATQSTADIDSQSKRVRPPFDGDKLASTFLYVLQSCVPPRGGGGEEVKQISREDGA